MAEAEELAQKITKELEETLEKDTEGDADADTYAVYTDQLKNLIAQLKADVTGQEQVQDVLKSLDFTGKENSTAVLEESIDGDERVISSLEQIQEKLNTYQLLISSALKLLDTDNGTVLAEKSMLTEMSDYLTRQAEINQLCMTLLSRYEQESGNTGSNTSGNGENESETTRESESENPDHTDGSTTGPGGAGENGNTGENRTTGGNGAAGGSGATGGTGAAGGNLNAGGTEAAGSTGGTQDGQSSQISGQNGQASLSGEEISLLGDAYDLSEVEQLLSREPSDSEDAQDLIDELQDSQETVEAQYEELQRKEKIFALEIQHTYDTAVLAGKLAELTYQQETEELNETL